MATLMLGPVLRHAVGTEATVWVEVNAPCVVSVLGCESGTFCVGGHHYALVHVEGLEPGTVTPYEVHLDGERAWPEDDSWPQSVIRTATPDKPLSVVFGSCRTAYPHEEPYTLTKDQHEEGREVCALRSLALRLRGQDPSQWPTAIVHLGDQIYADEVDPQTADLIAGEQIADFEEYTLLYKVSWSEPAIRWLMSTVSNSMIFDDHDVIDDWNTSSEWLEEIRAQRWWDDRIVGAFVSYWVYQHIGNLTPQALHEDPMFDRIHDLADGLEMLREFACHADRDPCTTRWSFCRDLGSARLIVIDSRAARVLDPEQRAMVDDAEWAFIEEAATSCDAHHLLLGTSLPWLLTPGLQHLEAFNEAISGGAWGDKHVKRAGEKMRQAVDMEHWGAFQKSFVKLTELIGRVGAGVDGREPPATITALSGDVHHAYLAEVEYPPADGVRSRVYQAVASPFRNPLDSKERRVIKAAATKPAAAVARGLARAAGVARPRIKWKLREKPIFDNVVAMVHLDGRDAKLQLYRSRSEDGNADEARLELVYESAL